MINNDDDYFLIPKTKTTLRYEKTELLTNKGITNFKFCYTCEIYRPLGTSHCAYCDNCVE